MQHAAGETASHESHQDVDYTPTSGQIGHYRVERVVARTSVASILRATDLRNGRPVAIKVPYPETESDPVFFERFHREKEVCQKLDHPGIVKVMPDDGESQQCIVMEWVGWKPLRHVLSEKGKVPAGRAVCLAVRICDALDYLHKHGIVHRDVKPENIMVDAEDGIKLIDFGIAASAGARRMTLGKLSQTMGTPDYISPEQVKGQRGDRRSDLYALGVMLYEMLSGSVPFKGSNAYLIMNDRLLNDPVPPREIDPTISPELQEVVYRALERNPANRYASAHEFAWDLEHLDQVGVADRQDLRAWKRRRSPRARQKLSYLILATIPLLIFVLMLYTAHHG